MTWIVVDCETDGPCPGLYSLVSVGAVVLDRALDKTFYGRFAPLPEASFQIEALAVSGTRREDHEGYPQPDVTSLEFHRWVCAQSDKSVVFVSDNPAFDFAFVNYYFHAFVGENPFGFSARRIGDLYAGLKKDARASWKHLRKTSHTHHPVDDARGNAEALLSMVDMGLHIPGVSP